MSWTVKTSAYGSNNYRLAVEIKVNSQSITDNSTLLSYRVYTDNTGYSSSWVAYYSRSVTINGTTVYSASNRISGYKNQTLKSGTIRIPHNADGTKSINVSLSADIYSSSGNRKTGSQSITLPRIDRGIYDFKLGKGWEDIEGPKTVTFSKYNSNAKVQIVFAWWDYVKSEKTYYYNLKLGASGNEIADNYTSGYNLYLTDSIKDNMKESRPDNWKGWGYVQARVFIGDKRIETHTLEVPGIIVSHAKPSLSFTAEFIGKNQSLLGSKTKGLKGVHKLKLNFDASAKEYASIKRYEIEFEGKKTTTTKSSIELNTTRPGKSDVKVTVYDSRDWSASSSTLVEVINYELPKLSHKAFRVENGQENPIGETARVTGLVSITSVKNTLGREVNEAWWQLSLDNIKRSTNSIMYSQTLSINNEKAYTLKYGDKFTTASISGVIPVGHAPLVLGKESVGVNVVPPENGRGLYIGKDSKLHIGHKYFLEFVPSDPNLERNDALYIARDNRQYGLALIWNKLYFIKDYKYYEMFKKEDLSSVDINTFTIPETYVSSSYSDSFENEYILEKMYQKAPIGLSFHTYKQRSQGFVILYKYNNGVNATALFVRYGYLPGSYMRNGHNSWVQNSSAL